MKVEIRLEVKDYLAAQRLHFRPRFAMRAALAVLGGFLLAAFGQQIWTIAHHGVLPRWWWMLPAGLAYGAVLFCFFLPWKVGRIFKENPRLAEPMKIDLSDTGLLMESSRGQVRAPWSMLKSWKQNGSLILIYHSRVHFHIFPRRSFASAEDYAAAGELLKKHLGAERV
jgi:YcxB-like protein